MTLHVRVMRWAFWFFHVVDNRFAVLCRFLGGLYPLRERITVKIQQMVLGRGTVWTDCRRSWSEIFSFLPSNTV